MQIQQVYPYEMAWRSRIDDYLTDFENIISKAKLGGYSPNQTLFYQWTYADALLFCLQLVTGQGNYQLHCNSNEFNFKVNKIRRYSDWTCDIAIGSIQPLITQRAVINHSIINHSITITIALQHCQCCQSTNR